MTQVTQVGGQPGGVVQQCKAEVTGSGVGVEQGWESAVTSEPVDEKTS